MTSFLDYFSMIGDIEVKQSHLVLFQFGLLSNCRHCLVQRESGIGYVSQWLLLPVCGWFQVITITAMCFDANIAALHADLSL
jgi:hypothetical protein